MATVEAVPEVIAAQLAPGEVVEVLIRGVHGQRMYGTDRRVFVYKKGLLAGSLLGRKVASWDYRNISGVHLDRGALYGVVAIQAAGISATPVRYQSANRSEDAFTVRHAVPVARIWDELEASVARLRWLISAAQLGSMPAPAPAAPAPAPAPTGTPDPLPILRRLAELHEAGVITDADYARRTAQILART